MKQVLCLSTLLLLSTSFAQAGEGRKDLSERQGQVPAAAVSDSPLPPDLLLFREAQEAEKQGDLKLAVTRYLKLFEQFGGSKFRAQSLLAAAFLLEKDKQYSRAAKRFEQYASTLPREPEAPMALFKAGLLREKSGEIDSAQRLFGLFFAKYGKDKNQRENLVVATMKIAELKARRSKVEEAFRWYRKTIALFNKSKLPLGGRAAQSAARAQFLLAEDSLGAYMKIGFAVPSKDLKSALKRKTAALQDIEKKYKKVFSYKNMDWTLASMYRIGYLYENFALVMLEAPCPKILDAEGCDVYRDKLREYSLAITHKAASAYRIVRQKSEQFKLENEWTKKATEGLARLTK